MAALPKHAATASSESQDTTAEGKSVEKKNRLGRTELHNAVCSGDKDYVQQLLKNRASVDATDGSGRTPLHLAASELSEPVKIIELLLEARARTEAEDLSGFTPLNLACDSKCKEAVAVLQSAEGLSKVAEGMTEDQIGTEESPANYTEGTFKELMKDPEVAMQRFTEEMAKEQNPKTLALLYTYRSLARELARRPPPEAEQDRDMANTWAASDPEIQKQIQNVRKWIPIGHRVRGDPLAQQQAEGTDFLLSFTTADKAANDPLLVRLNNGSVRFEGGYREVTFCHDRSLNMGQHWTEDGGVRLDQATPERKPGELPTWFVEYMKAAKKTEKGILILQLTEGYFKSKACRWEFEYLKDPDRVHVLVQDEHGAQIVQWNELCSNPELCRKAFPLEPGEEKLKELRKSVEDQAYEMWRSHAHETMEAIAAMAKVCAAADLVRMQEQQAWCELPLRQMSSALAEAFCEKRVVIGAKISLLKVLIETGQSKKARKVGEELLKDEEGCGWQKNDPERLRLLNNLGPVYSSLHLYDKAFKTLEECKELAEERRDDLQVARVLNNLGPVYVEQGKWEEAKDVLERCLKIYTDHFEKQNPNLSKCLQDLGVADRTKEAKNMEDWLKEIGKEYPEVATCLNNLGNAYGKLKNFDLQIEKYNSAYRIHFAHLGADHPHVASTLNNMVVSMVEGHKKSEEWEEAEKKLQWSLRVHEQHFGENHPAVTPAVSNLGVFCGERGRHEEEKDLLERCLAIQKKHEEDLKEHLKEQFRPDDKNIAVTLSNLGHAYRRLHELCQDHHNRDQALEKYDQSLKRRARFILAKHLDIVAMCNDNLGDVLFANDWLQRCMEIEKQHWGSEHQDLVPIMTKSAQIYIGLKDYDQANHLLSACLQLYEHRFPSELSDSPQVGECLYNLGIVAILREDYAQAQTLFERCLKAYENHYDRSHLKVEETLKYLFRIYIRLKDPRAIDTLNRCIQIQEDSPRGAQHDFVRTSAVEFENAGDYEKAEQFLKRCLMIKNQNPLELMVTMRRLVEVYERSLLPNKQLLQSCLRIEKECFGEKYPRIEKLKKFVLRFCDLPKGSLDKLAESSLEMKEGIFGKEDVQLTVELRTLAKGYRKLSKHQEECNVLKHCVEIEEQFFGPNDLKVSKTLFDLGLACRDWHEGSEGDSESEKALAQAFEALDRCRNIRWEHRDGGEVTEATLIETLSELGQVCRESKKLQRAQELLEHCLEFVKNQGDTLMVSKCLLDLADVHADLGNCNEADALYKECGTVRDLQLELKGIADPKLDKIVEAAEHNAKLLRSTT